MHSQGSNGRYGAAGAALVAALLLVAATPLAAQQERDGDPERCDCGERILRRVAPLARGEALGRLRLLTSRAELGVELDMQITEEGRGAVVRRVAPGSPAARAGVRQDDEIVSVNGTSLLRPLPEDEPELREGRSAAAQRLIASMRGLEPGDTLAVELLRDGRREGVSVVLEGGPFSWIALTGDAHALEAARGAAAPGPGAELFRYLPHAGGRLGAGALALPGLRVRYTALNPQLGEYFGADSGVLILEVGREPALDLRAGDVVLSVDGRAVEDPGRFGRILGTYREGEPLRLEVLRKRARVTVEGTVRR